MKFNFDRIIDRHSTNSVKWGRYGPDVLPLWVADMDFSAPEPIQAALQRTVEHGIFGYEFPTKALVTSVATRMEKLYGWRVEPEAVLATPGIIAGFIAAANTVCTAGEGVLIQPPVYPPFLSVHEKAGLISQYSPLRCDKQRNILKYQVDIVNFKKGLNSEGAQTGMFLLCNPHNPTGNIFTRNDLSQLAELCLKNGTVICSDEIHSELLLGEVKHTPIAALNPEVAAKTITLIAPSKTFNVPGLFCGFAIISDSNLREKYKNTLEKMAMHVNSLGLIAAQTAFSGACDEWLAEIRAYLKENRDFLVNFVRQDLAGVSTTVPEATYLAWLDFSNLKLQPNPYQFILERAKVALNDGSEFGPGGGGFVRLNFACPRSILVEALKRIKCALL
jgi:cysteine-S-conjugate beta-lyase